MKDKLILNWIEANVKKIVNAKKHIFTNLQISVGLAPDQDLASINLWSLTTPSFWLETKSSRKKVFEEKVPEKNDRAKNY